MSAARVVDASERRRDCARRGREDNCGLSRVALAHEIVRAARRGVDRGADGGGRRVYGRRRVHGGRDCVHQRYLLEAEREGAILEEQLKAQLRECRQIQSPRAIVAAPARQKLLERNRDRPYAVLVRRRSHGEGGAELDIARRVATETNQHQGQCCCLVSNIALPCDSEIPISCAICFLACHPTLGVCVRLKHRWPHHHKGGGAPPAAEAMDGKEEVRVVEEEPGFAHLESLDVVDKVSGESAALIGTPAEAE